MALSFQSVTLDTNSPDRDALLVFRDGGLLAVLSCLSDIHGDLTGKWFLEATFGELPASQSQVYDTLAAFEDWLAG